MYADRRALPTIINDNKILDPLRAKKTFIRKMLGYTMVLAIKASLISDPISMAKGARGKYYEIGLIWKVQFLKCL